MKLIDVEQARRCFRGIRTIGSNRAWQCMYDAAGLNKIADTETVVENWDVTRLVTEAVARRVQGYGTA